MTYIDNGSRLHAVRHSLAKEKGITVIEVSSSRTDNKKARQYDETKFIVAPSEGSIPESGIKDFAGTLLNDVEPVFTHNLDRGEITTFDTLGERHFQPIAVKVFPSVEAAQAILE